MNKQVMTDYGIGVNKYREAGKMTQKMVWKRLCFGESEKTAEETLGWAEKQGDTAKIVKGKMGYSVLIKAHSFKR